jgi:hypothetical protein
MPRDDEVALRMSRGLCDDGFQVEVNVPAPLLGKWLKDGSKKRTCEVNNG